MPTRCSEPLEFWRILKNILSMWKMLTHNFPKCLHVKLIQRHASPSHKPRVILTENKAWVHGWVSGCVAVSHLSNTHVELDADDKEISLLLAGGHQRLVGITHCVDLLSNHRDCLASRSVHVLFILLWVQGLRKSVRSKVEINPSTMVTMVAAVDNWHHVASLPDPRSVFYCSLFCTVNILKVGWGGWVASNPGFLPKLQDKIRNGKPVFDARNEGTRGSSCL